MTITELKEYKRIGTWTTATLVIMSVPLWQKFFLSKRLGNNWQVSSF